MTETKTNLIEALGVDIADLEREMNEEARHEREMMTETKSSRYLERVSRASEMLQRDYSASDTLLDPILPRQGVVALVGSSDSGKSSLLRGLAMAIVSGKSDYIGFPLNTRYRRAMYISTEDDEASLSRLMRMQIIDSEREQLEGLHFIFDTDNLLETIELGLESNTPDVVIVDAFADLYTGPMNENNRVRSFLNAFSQLAVRYNTLIIFLHHTGKRTESLAPSKHNAIGSQGFEAKMRLMMELRQDPTRHDIRHLCIVKGNYLPREYKHDSFELRFTPTLNFEATGERVPFTLLREHSEERDQRVEQARALREEGMTLQQIADVMGYKTKSSVCKLLKSLDVES
ncbi:MAG: AAA family ATPase [Alistipes sp.]|nr:AAA family ATPase [Alistipes sp.]